MMSRKRLEGIIIFFYRTRSLSCHIVSVALPVTVHKCNPGNLTFFAAQWLSLKYTVGEVITYFFISLTLVRMLTHILITLTLAIIRWLQDSLLFFSL